MIAIWREIGTFEITEQRRFDQVRVIRTNEWLNELELEKIKRKTLTPRDGEENQEINLEERIWNENGPIEPNEAKIHISIETEITHEKHLIIDELKALMIRNETEEYLPFKKVDQKKLKDVTKKVNAVIKHIKIDGVTQTNKTGMALARLVAKVVGVKKDKKVEKKELW